MFVYLSLVYTDLFIYSLCNTLKHSATQYITESYHAVCERQTWQTPRCRALQHAATHCNTLQHNATHCNTLQHTATHCNKIHECVKSYSRASNKADTTLQHTATHRNTLQHTATHCDTQQHTATHYNTLQNTTTYYNTAQHIIWISQVIQWSAKQDKQYTPTYRNTP